MCDEILKAVKEANEKLTREIAQVVKASGNFAQAKILISHVDFRPYVNEDNLVVERAIFTISNHDFFGFPVWENTFEMLYISHSVIEMRGPFGLGTGPAVSEEEITQIKRLCLNACNYLDGRILEIQVKERIEEMTKKRCANA